MKNYVVTVNGVQYEVSVEECGNSANNTTVSAPRSAPSIPARPVAPAASQASTNSSVASNTAQASGKQINAPMPGNILDIKVAKGDTIKKGDVVVILEAMKMENDITAPEDCTVTSINVTKGTTVNTGDIIITYDIAKGR